MPENNWTISLQPGQCVDIVPAGEDEYVVRAERFGRGCFVENVRSYISAK